MDYKDTLLSDIAEMAIGGMSTPALLELKTNLLGDDRFAELVNKIEEWARNRNLLISGHPKRQAIKTLEEVMELQVALHEDNEAAIVDAIGDIIVTLVVLSKQLELDLVDCVESAYNVIKNRSGSMINGTFVKNT